VYSLEAAAAAAAAAAALAQAMVCLGVDVGLVVWRQMVSVKAVYGVWYAF
jgi:hypothetical protein